MTSPARAASPAVVSEIDEAAFRRTLGRFASGVTFVTAEVGGAPEGLIVSSFASVSLRPPLVSFCPSRSSLTWQRMRAGRRFGVNVLSEQQAAFVTRAAPAGADRFGGVAYRWSAGGVPVLDDALAFVECEIEAEHAAGDHWIVVGRVTGLAADPERRPLVAFGGRLGGLAEV
jgi:flavin reductase (DIM6/NTAB) family NADH-FMN oxidoreductase RutF